MFDDDANANDDDHVFGGFGRTHKVPKMFSPVPRKHKARERDRIFGEDE